MIHRRLGNIANVQENFKSTIFDRFNGINCKIIDSQQKWNTITDILKESAKTTVGHIERSKRSGNINITMLSDMQRNVEKQFESATNEETELRLKIYPYRIMTEIYRERKQENVKVRTFIQPVLDNQNENQRIYEAVKNINKMRSKQHLVIKSDEGQTKGKTQTKIVAKHFSDIFWKDVEPMPDLRPIVMSNPFTSDEIKKAVSKMKMKKSPGCDEIPVELIMYAPDSVYESITEIFKQISSDGDCPKETNHGIRVLLQKPGKPRGPASNLRQSFSSLRLERYSLFASWTELVAD